MYSLKKMTSRLPLLALALIATLGLLGETAVAQIDGGAGIDDLTDLQNNAGGGGGDIAGGGDLETVEPIRLGFDIEDVRNQGFVGPAAPTIEENGFVGPPSPNNPLGLSLIHI